MVLQSAGDNFGGRGRPPVDQHDDRHFAYLRRQISQVVIARAAQIILWRSKEFMLGIRRAAIGRSDERFRRQECRGNADCGVKQAARVVAQVEHQAFERALLVQIRQMLSDDGSRAFLERSDAQIAVTLFNELGFDASYLDDLACQR